MSKFWVLFPPLQNQLAMAEKKKKKPTLKGKEGKNWIVDWAHVSSILCSCLVQLASLHRWLWPGPSASTSQELDLQMPELLQFHKIEEKRITFQWKGNLFMLQENGCVPLSRSFLSYPFGLKYKIFASLGLALNNSWRPGDNRHTMSANIKHREICVSSCNRKLHAFFLVLVLKYGTYFFILFPFLWMMGGIAVGVR